MTREELRVAAINTIKSYHNIAIQAGTGVGKSAVALYALKSIESINNVLIVVGEIAHIKTWENEIAKWGISFNNIKIVCYASLRKVIYTAWDGVIFDEAHHLNSDLRLDLFSKINSRYNIFLSATLKDSLLYSLKYYIGEIKSIELGLQEAFDSNILAEPKIFLIPLELNDNIPTEIITEEWGRKEKRVIYNCSFKDRWKYIRNKASIPNAILNIHCTQKQKYDYISEQFEYYRNRYMCNRNEVIKNKWLQCGSKRKIYLGNLKTDVANELIFKLKDKRFICFCTNIAQSELIGGDNAVHSKRKDCSKIIDKFNNKEINSLFAIGMLQEGVNLTDINAGIIIQLDGEERSFIQKFGRALRSNSPEQYILYYKNTRDEEYLNKALEGIDKKYIKILNND